VVTVGGGFVWTGNDDERNTSGSVSKIDPATNRVVGNVTGIRSPQSIAFGLGAVWVADHAGWLVKIDPSTLEILARQRLDFGAHGVVVAGDAVYVADAHADRLLEADPETARIRRIVELPVGLIYPAAGAGSLWSGSAAVWDDEAADDRIVRVDPRTLRVVKTLHMGGNVPAVAFGFGSVWAALRTGSIVRTTPSATS
jgi:virginiamycin B lyase